MPVTKLCKVCGNAFTLPPSWAAQRTHCSRACMVIAYKANPPGSFSPEYRQEHQRPWQERFWEKVDKSGECWEWQGYINPGGYGQFTISYKSPQPAHRLAYEDRIGPIPEGLVIDHLCRNTRCVNPAHLEPVTVRENTLRGVGPAATYAKRTHCVKGHELAGSNLAIRTDGSRKCRRCHADYIRERYHAS